MTRLGLCPPICIALLVACVGCPGPVDIATRGYTELVGVEDTEEAIVDVSPAELAGHGSIHLNRVVSEIGPLLSANFPDMVADNLRRDLARLKGMRAGPPLQVVCRIVYYQTANAIEIVRGKAAMAVMHVTVTAASGRRLGEFLVIASSNALRVGDAELAQALARGTAKYFQQRLSKLQKI